jgi:Fe-S cluster assembly iron-binding protein IscA
MALDELNNEQDIKLKDNEINIIYDDSLKSFVESNQKLTIDYKDSLFGSGFVIDSGSYC